MHIKWQSNEEEDTYQAQSHAQCTQYEEEDDMHIIWQSYEEEDT
jgi:hypothetical protein